MDRVKIPRQNQGPRPESSLRRRAEGSHQSDGALSNHKVRAPDQKSVRKASGPPAGPPKIKAKEHHPDDFPDLTMMDSIQLHPTDDGLEEFGEREGEDDDADPGQEEANSYRMRTLSKGMLNQTTVSRTMILMLRPNVRTYQTCLTFALTKEAKNGISKIALTLM